MKKMLLVYLILVLMVAATACSPSDRDNSAAQQSVSNPPAPSGESGGEEAEEAQHDFFIVPPMTDTFYQYYEEHVAPLLWNSMLLIDWSDDDYAQISTAPSGAGSSAYLLMAFEDMVGAEEMSAIWDEYGADIPAAVIDETLQERFSFTVDQLHEILYAHYNVAEQTYSYEAGRGGGPIEAAVVDATVDGDVLILRYEIFTGYSGLDGEQESYLYKTPGTLTLWRVNDRWVYQSVAVEGTQEAEALSY